MAQHELEPCFLPEFQAKHCEELTHQVGHLFVPTAFVVPRAGGQHQLEQLQVRQLMPLVVQCEEPVLRSQFLRLVVRVLEDQ